MSRSFFEASVMSFLVLLVGSCRESSPPNVILISIDCLNQRQMETALEEGYAQALGELKDDAVSFSRAYTHAPWTTPSHMSMLTGLYPSQHGRDVPYGLMIRHNEFYPRLPAFETMGGYLRSAGYDTAAFVGQGSISGVYGLSQGFDVFEEHRKKAGSWTDLEASIESVTGWLADRERSTKPFFLFFHTYDFHEPRPKGLPSDREAMQYIDRFLSRLLVRLKSDGLYESSLIVLTGDHGSNMIETDDKCCVHGAGHYEENLNVPLLIKLPGAGEAREDPRIARHVDLLPTVLEATRWAATFDGPGRSLLREDSEADETIYSFSEADGRCASRRALVTDRYKYIYTPSAEDQALLQQDPFFFDETCVPLCRELPIEELYDLRKDPFEKQNLLEGRLNDEHAAWLERFRREMALHLNLPQHYTQRVVTGPEDELDEQQKKELLDSLRTLGYIQ